MLCYSKLIYAKTYGYLCVYIDKLERKPVFGLLYTCMYEYTNVETITKRNRSFVVIYTYAKAAFFVPNEFNLYPYSIESKLTARKTGKDRCKCLLPTKSETVGLTLLFCDEYFLFHFC